MRKPVTYADVREAFEPDGSWRDLYAFETTEVEWRKFLKAALESDWPTELRVNYQTTDQIEKVLATNRDAENSASLSIDVSGATLMCYFFDDEEATAYYRRYRAQSDDDPDGLAEVFGEPVESLRVSGGNP